MKKIVIFGSTGSIGTTLLNLIKKDKKNFKIELISANKNYKKLIKQAEYFKVKNLIIADKDSFLKAKKIIKKKNINIYNSYDDIDKIFKNKIDYTMSSVSGLSGLNSTMKIIKFTKNIAIANKESIICAWNLIEKELIKHKTNFIPIDSEHFSIWSLIGNTPTCKVDKIIITASGGPFLNHPFNKFDKINIKDALKHPNWSMGKKISIDSATMMNKVFEVIEAKNIFNLDYKKLSILIHSKSYIHAIVKFNNGLTKILVHDTSMKIPIFNSLYLDQNKTLKSNNLDIKILNNLSLKSPDKKKFPVIKILKYLPRNTSLFETILVTVNDFLVNKFLNKKIKFNDISKHLIKLINDKDYAKYKKKEPKNIKQIIQLSNFVSLKLDSKSI
jgi:1-deoxy-D-xylulose-5-phosphate reductoisomerase